MQINATLCRRLVLTSILAVIAFTISGCKWLSNQGGTTVFYIQTQGRLIPTAGCPPSGCSGYVPFPLDTSVYGNEFQPGGNPEGALNFYQGITLSLDPANPASFGLLEVENPIVNAYWNHDVFFPSYCQTPPGAYMLNEQGGTITYEQDEVWMAEGNTFPWICNTTQLPETGPASLFAYAGAVPSSITLPEINSGNPFSATYGPPNLNIYSGANGVPSYYATETASTVASTGASATFPLPSSLPQGAYMLVTGNENSSGNYITNAFNVYVVAGTQTISGNPFGVAAGGLTTTTSEIIDEGGHFVGPITSTTYSALPIVSLYSNGQVLIGGTAVTVGSNPTAVAVFAGPSSETEQNEGDEQITTTISGTSRAAVANSGSNTISILDVIHHTVLSTVAVGNQPVALAVNSSGSTGYVANYTDGTVTEVNLSTDAPVTAVAVGGSPTSLALTASGILWVGGVGFLTEINTSNMSVVATESTSGKTISALGYTDGYSKLIAVTSNSSGNVFIDSINPSSVETGGTYTPVASNEVSTLGTYLNPLTHTDLLGYTATVTTSTVPITSDQAGAPPLIVQDQWAVVTATPTGFTITDASANVVLTSQTTSSPIAGLAIDPNVNTVYLTMPDSNTLLTVPLPGTGSN